MPHHLLGNARCNTVPLQDRTPSVSQGVEIDPCADFVRVRDACGGKIKYVNKARKTRTA